MRHGVRPVSSLPAYGGHLLKAVAAIQMFTLV